jgi:hypothetical protein
MRFLLLNKFSHFEQKLFYLLKVLIILNYFIIDILNNYLCEHKYILFFAKKKRLKVNSFIFSSISSSNKFFFF